MLACVYVTQQAFELPYSVLMIVSAGADGAMQKSTKVVLAFILSKYSRSRDQPPNPKIIQHTATKKDRQH